MKFSQATLLAILVSSAFVLAAPANFAFENSMVRREDVSQALSILEEIKEIKRKRSYTEDPAELAILSARDDSAITQLITALANSGIASDVWNVISNDSDLKSEVSTIVKAAIQGAITYGPGLIKAIWNSGLLSTVFQDLANDDDFKSALLSVAKSIFSSAVNLISSAFSGKSDTTSAAAATATTTTSVATTTAAAKRNVLSQDFEAEFLDKRDVSSIISSIVSEIKDSGVLSTLLNKVLADPEKAVSFLTSVLKYGVVAIEDVLDWAKSSGVLQSGLDYIEENGGKYGATLATVLSGLISNGTISASDIDNAFSNSTGSATSVAAYSGSVYIIPSSLYNIATTTNAADASLYAAASKAEAALNGAGTTATATKATDDADETDDIDYSLLAGITTLTTQTTDASDASLYAAASKAEAALNGKKRRRNY